MFTKNINFKNFQIVKINSKLKKNLKKLLDERNQIINSFDKSYKNSYNRIKISKYKKFSDILLIGMGGSILGAKAIYNFFKDRIKKKFYFIDDLDEDKLKFFLKKNYLTLVISKSGNTLETISNSNIIVKQNQKNIFLTENKNSYLFKLANKLKAEIIHHNNYIGGRYSVLSEVGMLPAELMGLNQNKFKGLNELIKNKKFLNSLILNVSNLITLVNKKKSNSIILNYDKRSNDFFLWYQQLVAESLGKKGKGILPVISNMPKDNHSLMQHYLDGIKNNFYTFYFVKENNSKKISKELLFKSHNFLKNKTINDIKFSQYLATENVFNKKKIPYRSFMIKKRDEKTLGELFIFFMLETILLGRALKLNPFNQPAVELIKDDTKNILNRN